MAGPTNPFARALLRAPVIVFRMHLGWIFGGHLVLLETFGRSSGTLRRTVVEVVRVDRAADRYWVVAGWGRGSDWYLNALATAPRRIDTGLRSLDSPSVHELDEAEREELLSDYQRRNPRLAAQLGKRLLGDDFSSAPEALHRLAEKTGALCFSASQRM